MSVVRINALTVPADRREELEARFAARAREVSSMPGFEGFELLRPTDDRSTWLVLTRWRDEASFDAWMGSRAFDQQHAHRGTGQTPLGVSSELWSYEVAQLSGGAATPAP